MKNNPLLDATSFADSLFQLFQVLNKKEQHVIKGRYGFNKQNKKETLESIGNDLNITRERVRQIQKTGIQKLQRTLHTNKLNIISELITNHLKENNYFLNEKDLISSVATKITIPQNEAALITLLCDVSNEISKIKKTKKIQKAWSIKSKVDTKNINSILKIGVQILKDEKKTITPIDFLNRVQNQLKEKKKGLFSRSTLSNIFQASFEIKLIDEGYGLSKWRTVCPKSIRDKAIIVFNRYCKPLHFSEVCELIHQSKFDNKKVTLQAVHNELIRYNDFVLIGRGIYALQDWGFTTGTVKDIIHQILDNQGPLTKTKIIEEVLKERKVKIGTISLNLQKHPEFKRVGRAVYSL